ncbi:MAG: SDR family NAD(P)-dependent oxidoreductase [Chloroflexi bacterium]|nr:SDR family NAD(P)-dependent oxidoreductase [Chloroflexota bacterium]MCY4246892.1 SDR family NAD(P)-dependent oxidoreductase [Chloroflexota bacterium]
MGALRGKTIIITGASSGFGEAAALACAEAGANVSLVARRQAELERVARLAREAGGRALVCAADVSDDRQIYAAVDKTRAEFGAIDVLFNNAGANMRARSIADTTPEQWRWLMNVNLTSAFVFTRAVLDEMKTRGAGLIINLASRAGMQPSLTAGASYSASKIGMDALTQVTNQEGNPHGVRACLFNPGLGDTPIINMRPTAFNAEQRAKMIQPEDIAATVVFLCSLPPRVNIDLISMLPTQQ